MSASILCFCETWLSASQPSPVIFDDQIHVRCDKITCENKGGVMICVPSQVHPSNIHRFASNGIEAVSATMNVPNFVIQVAAVYRSPSVPLASLLTILSRLIMHVTLNTQPCVVLGEDLLHKQRSALLNLMSSFGFIQLVQSPTTTQGTLIDHVYYRNSSNSPSPNIIHTCQLSRYLLEYPAKEPVIHLSRFFVQKYHISKRQPVEGRGHY